MNLSVDGTKEDMLERRRDYADMRSKEEYQRLVNRKSQAEQQQSMRAINPTVVVMRSVGVSDGSTVRDKDKKRPSTITALEKAAGRVKRISSAGVGVNFQPMGAQIRTLKACESSRGVYS
jgi:hypothetical protein